MAYRCHECKYECPVWCDKFDDACDGCERVDEDGHCKCLLVNLNDCPDFVPKEDSDEKADLALQDMAGQV